jgi:predicted molibdopterin-dependent oxidoreductase YjgC
MSDTLRVSVDGRDLTVPAGCTVAAAVLQQNGWRFRRSIGGEPRGPLCGMGICFECRVTIDGGPHQRSCNLLCAAGMRIVTEANTDGAE